MSKIIDLSSYRTHALKKKYFRAWEDRFKEKFSLTLCLRDISDQTLYRLAHPGEESSHAFYEFIMGVLELGPADSFGYLEEKEKLKIIDIHLFLADNVRYELMRRLGWLSSFTTEKIELVGLVQQTEDFKGFYQNNVPELAPTHLKYEHYRNLTPREKEVLIRGLLVSALEAFKKRI